MRSWLIHIILLGFTLSATAQHEHNFYAFPHVGISIKNDPRFPAVNEVAYGLEFTYLNQTSGKKQWQKNLNLPQIGVSVFGGSFGNPNVLGQGIGVIPVIKMRWKSTKRLDFYSLMGFGLGYLNKPYDNRENPLNTVIGSNINNATTAKLILELKNKRNTKPFIALSAFHFSNSKFRLPNLGINLFTFSVGTKFGYKPREIVDSTKTKSFRKKLFCEVRAGFGTSEHITSNSFKNLTYSIAVSANKLLSPMNKVKSGLLFYHSIGLETFSTTQVLNIDRKYRDASRLVAFIGHELMLGNVGFLSETGLHLLNGTFRGSIIYNRLGFQFYLRNNDKTVVKNAFLGVYVHANRGKAEFFDLATGFTF